MWLRCWTEGFTQLVRLLYLGDPKILTLIWKKAQRACLYHLPFYPQFRKAPFKRKYYICKLTKQVHFGGEVNLFYYKRALF